MKKYHICQMIVGVGLLVAMPAVLLAKNPVTFSDFAHDLADQGIITASATQPDYAMTAPISFGEITSITDKIRGVQGEKSQIFNSAEIPETQSADAVMKRVDAFSEVMRSVCVADIPDTLENSNRNEVVYYIASNHDFTSREWPDFQPDEAILRQEFFALASRAIDWVEKTGGCDPHRLSDLPLGQEPGTFVERFITTTQDIYSYVAPMGEGLRQVREKFLEALSLDESLIDHIVFRDESGEDVSTLSNLSIHALIYVFYDRPQEEYDFALSEVAFGQEPGTFAQRFETTDKKIYSYIVKDISSPRDVVKTAAQTFSVSRSSIIVRDEHGAELGTKAQLAGGQLVYVYVKK